jgi:hypothetical protein
VNTYGIWIAGAVDVDELNTICPHPMTAVRAEAHAALVAVETDQAGLIGLLRCLHGLGLTLLAVRWMQNEEWRKNANETAISPPLS